MKTAFKSDIDSLYLKASGNAHQLDPVVLWWQFSFMVKTPFQIGSVNERERFLILGSSVVLPEAANKDRMADRKSK